MFRNSNSAKKKFLRDIKEVYRKKNMVSGRNTSVPLSGKHHFKTDFLSWALKDEQAEILSRGNGMNKKHCGKKARNQKVCQSGSWQESAHLDRVIKESSTLCAELSEVKEGGNAVPWGQQQWGAITTSEPEREERGVVILKLREGSCRERAF